MASADVLQKGRAAYRSRSWASAYGCLVQADSKQRLVAGDLERLAVSAYLAGHDKACLDALQRSHHAWLEAGDVPKAVRAAFWLGLHLLLRGETGPATGWHARAERILERANNECVERGYLLLPIAEQHLGADDPDAAYASAVRAVEIGERFADADLTACARHLLGRALMSRGKRGEGLALLDEAMVAVTTGEVSPIMTGLIYCSVIDACQRMYAIDRAREWTAELARWCEEQPEMVAFSGACRPRKSKGSSISSFSRIPM